MTDIVERLRMRDEEEAAAEIERLKARETELCAIYTAAKAHVDRLRAALETSDRVLDHVSAELAKDSALVNEQRAKIERLKAALERARSRLETLGGKARKYPQENLDMIQADVLEQIDAALAPDTQDGTED